MKTKFASFVLMLALAAMACGIASPSAPVPMVPMVEETVFNPSSTPTATVVEPSATNTPIPILPAETHTPQPPTHTPLLVGPVAKVTGNEGVNVRIGPCNQRLLFNAPLGREFPVTGWYQSPNGHMWWRVKLTTTPGTPDEGWVYGEYVEVSNATDVPFVESQCISFTETPPTSVPPPTFGLPACQTKTWEFRPNFTIKMMPRLLLEGDREFAGNGPEVKFRVIITHDVYKAWATIQMRAKETAFDWTTAEDVQEKGLFKVPSGWRIRTMNLGKVNAATGLNYGDWLFSYTDDDFDVDIFEPQDGGPWSRIEAIGDRDGIDIPQGVPGGSTSGGTRAVIWFQNPMMVEVIQEGNCQ